MWAWDFRARRVLDALELELQMIVSPMCLLGAKKITDLSASPSPQSLVQGFHHMLD